MSILKIVVFIHNGLELDDCREGRKIFLTGTMVLAKGPLGFNRYVTFEA